jgi:hypothetical protein
VGFQFLPLVVHHFVTGQSFTDFFGFFFNGLHLASWYKYIQLPLEMAVCRQGQKFRQGVGGDNVVEQAGGLHILDLVKTVSPTSV